MSVKYTTTLHIHPRSGSESFQKPKITQRLRHNSSPNLRSRSQTRAKSPPRGNGIRSHLPSLVNHNATTNSVRQYPAADSYYMDDRAARERRAKSIEAQFRKAYSSSITDAPGGVQYTSPRKTTPEFAAYVLQPDGSMAAVRYANNEEPRSPRWDDKSALNTNKPVFEALKLERQAQSHGKTTGRIQSASKNPRERLSGEMLEWLASDRRRSEPRFDDRHAVHEETIIRTQSHSSRSPSPMIVNLRSRLLSIPDPQPSKPVTYHHPRSKSTSELTTHSKSRASPSKQISSHARVAPSPGVGSGRSSVTSRGTHKEPTNSTQVQQTYWRPTTPDLSPIRSPTTAHDMHPSSQMSHHDFICTTPEPQGLPASVSPDRDIYSKGLYDANQNVRADPVWKQFKYYEHCATSDL